MIVRVTDGNLTDQLEVKINIDSVDDGPVMIKEIPSLHNQNEQLAEQIREEIDKARYAQGRKTNKHGRTSSVDTN